MENSFFRRLNKDDRFMVGNLFFLYFIQGVFVLAIGSILPMMMEEYGLSYRISGLMISAHNVGNVVTGFFAGVFALKFGIKQSLLALNSITFIGFIITLITGNPVILIIALLMTGLGRGVVSNYNNQIVSELSGGSAMPLNFLHGCFAIGAVLAPVLVLTCTKGGNAGWRIAVYTIIGLGILSMFTSPFMNMKSVAKTSNGQKTSFTFLKDARFLRSAAIMFCYLCVEGSVMGWMVTYYTDSGVISENMTQLITSLLWITILLGRFICGSLSTRVSPPKMILIMSSGILGFLILLVAAKSQLPMLIASLGLGLAMSGMYGTTVANAGDVFGDYPMAMSIFMTLTAMGSVIAPSVIGMISQVMGIRTGMSALIVPAAILLLVSLLNRKKSGR